MKLADKYFAHLLAGNSDAAFILECKFGLAGYPPELVSVALKAIDAGEDPLEAIIQHTGLD